MHLGAQGTIVSVETITGPKATGETCNIVIDTRGEIPYWEGQSYGVIPPVSDSDAVQFGHLAMISSCVNPCFVRQTVGRSAA